MVNQIDIIAGFILILAGIVTTASYVDLGLVMVGIGVLIEAIKIMMQQDLK